MAAGNEVTLQELHDHTAAILARVEAGERLTVVAADGHTVGVLAPPLAGTPRDVLRDFPLADGKLRDDLARWQPDGTDDWVDPWTLAELELGVRMAATARVHGVAVYTQDADFDQLDVPVVYV